MKIDRDNEQFSFRYDYINSAGMAMAQLTENDIGKKIEDCCYAGTAEFLMEKYSTVMLTEDIVEYSDKVVLPNGQFEANTKLIPVKNNEQQITYIIGVTINITHLSLKSNEIKYINHLFSSFVDNVQEGLALFNLEGRFLMVNEFFYQLFSYKKAELLEMTFEEFQPHLKDSIKESIRKLAEGHKVLNKEVVYLTKLSDLINVKITLNPIYEDSGQYVAFVAIIENTTDKVRTKQELSDTQERYKLIAEHMQDLIQIIDRKGNIRYASPSHESVIGYRQEELLSKNVISFIHESDKEKLKNKFNRSLRKNLEIRFEFRMKEKDRNSIWVEANVNPVRNQNNRITRFVAAFRDISKRKNAEEKLKKLAFTDYLTGLTNRRVFEEAAEKAIARIKRQKRNKLANLYLDGDQFKKINDAHGHIAGDNFLISIGERLKGVIRKEDTISRIGGDEFAILTPSVLSAVEAESLAKKILQAMEKPFKLNGNHFRFSFSIGFGIYPDDGLELKELFKHADQGLYQAKSKGKNRYARFEQAT